MIDITNSYDLEEYLMTNLASFLEYADVDEDSIHSYIQHCLDDVE